MTTAMAVVGANGSGKTSLIKAGDFISHFISDSFKYEPGAPIRYVPHAAQEGQPSSFEVDIQDGHGTRWMYSLTLQREQVQRESLRRKNAGRRVVTVFEREWLESDSAYVVSHPGVQIATSEAVKVRPNVSFISWARQYGAEVVPELGGIDTNVGMMGRNRAARDPLITTAGAFQAAPALREKMRALLLRLDLGLTDIDLREMTQGEPGASDATKYHYPMGVHVVDGHKFILPFVLESSGTQSAFVLLHHLLSALSKGGLAFIDELDNDLHPMMLEPILRLFDSRETNPNGAQLIFSVQSPDVLRLMKPSQVTLVEKVDCKSTAYRGDEISGLRSSDNFYAKYMAGALGAIPQL